MHSRAALRILIVLGIAVAIPVAYSCSWATGYFYQVSWLRGKLVGVNEGDWRRPFRWMRQRVERGNVRLVLCEYRSPREKGTELPVVKAATTDAHGDFDFGTVGRGHYTLKIDGPGVEDSFDVEITPGAMKADRVLIDISPVYPDCTCGHEFRPIANR
jgi:hypothetical protein